MSAEVKDETIVLFWGEKWLHLAEHFLLLVQRILRADHVGVRLEAQIRKKTVYFLAVRHLGVLGQLFASQLVLEVTRCLAQILLGAAVAAADC